MIRNSLFGYVWVNLFFTSRSEFNAWLEASVAQHDCFKLGHCGSSICPFLRILRSNQNHWSVAAWLAPPCICPSPLPNPSLDLKVHKSPASQGKGHILLGDCSPIGGRREKPASWFPLFLAEKATGIGLFWHTWFSGNYLASSLGFQPLCWSFNCVI